MTVKSHAEVTSEQLASKADLVDGVLREDQWPPPPADESIQEYPTFEDFPETGEVGILYVVTSTNNFFKWRPSSNGYSAFNPTLKLGETSTTAYRGDRGKTAYDHSQAAHAPSGAEANPAAGSQANAEDSTGATIYGWTAQRLWQAIAKWADTATSIFKGLLHREGLETGTLKGIDLVRERAQHEEFDEPGIMEEISRNIQIKVSRPYRGGEALGIINRVKERAQASGYTNMRVKFKRPEGKQRSILMGTAREDAGDAVFTRCELIRVDQPLPQCLETIRDDVAQRITTLLLEARRN